MSVSDETILPAQPADGFTEIRPLGGNGYQSPSQLMVVNARLAGDASAGIQQIRFVLDPVFANLVNAVELTASGVSADTPYKMQVVQTGGESLQVTGDAHYSAVGLNNQCGALWSPPPLLLSKGESNVWLTIANGGASVELNVYVWIYCFAKRAEEFTPLDVLLATVPRGTSLN